MISPPPSLAPALSTTPTPTPPPTPSFRFPFMGPPPPPPPTPAPSPSPARSVRLVSDTARRLAASLCMELPQGYQVRFAPPRRSDAQNAKLHAMAADLSRQVPWCGQRLSVEQWKRFATAKLKKDKIVFDCNEDGEPDASAGLVVIGASTREMGVREMSDVIEWFYWMGAKHGVVWGDDVKKWGEP